ncbi:hypothetical protein NS319_06360 [Sphingomonas sanguinis]|uniref:Uncharacterized protein n=2 Tax=Sphingomonas sanguinis TaxID=33051 RepID=A0A147I183_9SPHN|nr:hypothetical protein NS319_06360 [Sphingomonas sanguinis]
MYAVRRRRRPNRPLAVGFDTSLLERGCPVVDVVGNTSELRSKLILPGAAVFELAVLDLDPQLVGIVQLGFQTLGRLVIVVVVAIARKVELVVVQLVGISLSRLKYRVLQPLDSRFQLIDSLLRGVLF